MFEEAMRWMYIRAFTWRLSEDHYKDSPNKGSTAFPPAFNEMCEVHDLSYRGSKPSCVRAWERGRKCILLDENT